MTARGSAVSTAFGPVAATRRDEGHPAHPSQRPRHVPPDRAADRRRPRRCAPRVRNCAVAGLAAALGLAACSGTTGTVQVVLVTAPDSHVLDGVQRLRLTVTDPRQVVEATRTSAGFDLALDFDPSQSAGALVVEGFDASGARVACGESPSFSLAAINATVSVYIAAPNSFALSPSALSTPLSGVAATALSYGAVLAGGRDPAGAPGTMIAVYNAFDHSRIDGIALLAARAGMAVASDGAGGVYLLGGTGSDGNPTGTVWRFDTTVSPNGQYTTPAANTSFARTGQLLIALGGGRYLATGTPALELVPSDGSNPLTALSGVDGLPATGAAASPGDGTPTAIFAGDSLVRFRRDGFDTLTGAGRSAATAVALPDSRVAVIGGTPAPLDVLVIDGTTGAVSTVPAALSTARQSPMVAATSRHVVVAGGTDASGAPIASADVLDATSLALLATLPIATGPGGFAIALPNGQILLGGGTPAVTALELFTPAPPTL